MFSLSHVFISLIISSGSVLHADEFVVPPLKNPVNDYAGMISSSVKNQLNASLRKLKEQGGTQIAVLTVKNLEGLTIEQASIQVVDKWKLGSEKKDNGILLLIARDERQMRIEVGQGVEGDLTDAYSKRIISESMTPLFRAGNVSEGVLLGVFQIAQTSNPNIDVEALFSLKNDRRYQRSPKGNGITGLFFILFILMLLFGGGGRGRGGGARSALFTALLLGASSSRSGFGGGGGFGGRSSGGFGGGGGGFSGGGASGGW